jgi:hypothetical protein
MITLKLVEGHRKAVVTPITKKAPLSKLQKEVGGYIETMFTINSPLGGNNCLTGFVNEEGLLQGLPVVMAVMDEHGYRPFAGDIVIVGLDYEEGETKPLTEVEEKWILSHFNEQTGILRLS